MKKVPVYRVVGLQLHLAQQGTEFKSDFPGEWSQAGCAIRGQEGEFLCWAISAASVFQRKSTAGACRVAPSRGGVCGACPESTHWQQPWGGCRGKPVSGIAVS